MNISSDAAVEPYEGWGGYGASKAALDQLTAVLGVEEPGLRVYAIDPGDMRTDMHQAAFPGEDIRDRPEPATVVPALLRLLAAPVERPVPSRRPAGRAVAAGHRRPEVELPDFDLRRALAASAPPRRRRRPPARRSTDRPAAPPVRRAGRQLTPGDLVVVNTSVHSGRRGRRATIGRARGDRASVHSARTRAMAGRGAAPAPRRGAVTDAVSRASDQPARGRGAAVVASA